MLCLKSHGREENLAAMLIATYIRHLNRGRATVWRTKRQQKAPRQHGSIQKSPARFATSFSFPSLNDTNSSRFQNRLGRLDCKRRQGKKRRPFRKKVHSYFHARPSTPLYYFWHEKRDQSFSCNPYVIWVRSCSAQWRCKTASTSLHLFARQARASIMRIKTGSEKNRSRDCPCFS